MGRLLKLTGVTITDATAPVIPHSAGVAGYTRRYYAGAVAGNAGDTISQVPSLLDTGVPVAKADGRPANMTLADDSGIRAVQMPAQTSGYGPLFAASSVPGDTNPFSLMVVAKVPANGVNIAALNGLALGRSSGGGWVWGAVGGASGGSGYMVVSSAATAWGCLIGTYAGGASSTGATLYGDGVKQATLGASPFVPSTTATTLYFESGNTTTQIGALIAEVVSWPFVLNDTQAAAARTAMKAKYPALT